MLNLNNYNQTLLTLFFHVFFNKLFIKPNTHNIENTLFLTSNPSVHEKNFVKNLWQNNVFFPDNFSPMKYLFSMHKFMKCLVHYEHTYQR